MNVNYRIGFAKNESARYIGHLDLMRAVERALRRSHVPMAFSGGFHPHMKMNFSTALSVGVTSEDEYFEIELCRPLEPQALLKQLLAHMPPGITLKAIAVVRPNAPSLMGSVHASAYRVQFDLEQPCGRPELERRLAGYLHENDCTIERCTRKGKRQMVVREFLRSLELLHVDERQGTLAFTLNIFPDGSIKPLELMQSLVGQTDIPIHLNSVLITRTRLYTMQNARLVGLLEV